MSEFKVLVVKIGAVTKHPGADSLSLAKVEGETVVFRTGDFTEGDLAVYIPVDAVVPTTVAGTEFLGNSRRVKAKRLRGVYSEGILLPASTVPASNQVVGLDVGDALGITKHQDKVPETCGTGTQGPSLPPRTSLVGRFFHWAFSDAKQIQPKDPGCIPVYNIESFKKHSDLIEDGEGVVISEKIHGCLRPNTNILMADSSRRRIKDVQVGEFILGMDPNGAAVASKVIKTYDNGETTQWLDIRATRGPDLCCTPNHQVYLANKQIYVNAEDLNVGDVIVFVNYLDMAPTVSYKPALLRRTVTRITPKISKAPRCDLETETHNYFAEGILVHNSNFRAGWAGDQFYIGSHNKFWRDMDKRVIPFREKLGQWVKAKVLHRHSGPLTKPNLYCQVANQYNLEERLCVGHLAFYGEVYGQVQDLRYGAQPGQVWLRIFDIFDIETKTWLDWDAVEALCKDLGLDTVPVLYRGPFSKEKLLELTDGQSTLAKNIREGVVVKPAKTRIDPRFGRVILKSVSQAYKLRGGAATELQ
jgi:hypothetical protein